MSRGGYRPGAGRKNNSGLYKEKTVSRRIPSSLAPALDNYLENLKVGGGASKHSDVIHAILSAKNKTLTLPFFSSRVAAGLPHAAESDQESFDLTHHLVRSPTSTFIVQVSGESMIHAGIQDGDILVVDHSIEAKNGQIVIAVINGEVTVKRLHLQGSQITLTPENPDYPILSITELSDFKICGVVTSVIHKLKV